MDQKLAVLFMPDDMTLTKEKTPLMLRPILFCPILTWMVEELMGRGIERFFIVSDKRAHDMMRPYVPENADVVYVDGARHGEELLTLLKDEKGSVLIVNTDLIGDIKIEGYEGERLHFVNVGHFEED